MVKIISYVLFVFSCLHIQAQKISAPKPTLPNCFVGDIELQLATGEKMIPVLDSINGMFRYRIADEFVSKTRYQIFVSNDEPAYVYVIGSDLRNQVSRWFPLSGDINAAMTYGQNHMAIPDETYYMEMDDTPGTDYMCVLYSKDALDIDGIIEEIKLANGNFYNKVKHAIADRMVLAKDVRYVLNNIGFSARTDKTIVPVIVEISHK